MEPLPSSSIPKPFERALQGIVLAFGAPIGWLLLQIVSGASLWMELADNYGLYLYLFFGTATAFAAYGGFLGHRERQLLEKNRRLEVRSMTDRLTGLRNSRYFWRRFREACAEAERQGDSLALLVLDLDHFKDVNDEWGHRIGDNVLAAAGTRIAENVREADTAARVGGEEFAVLLPRTDAETAREVGERIRAAFAETEFTIRGGRHFHLTLSVGVAAEQGLEIDEERLFQTADAALYRAKEKGRNRVCFLEDPPADKELQEISSPST